MCMLTLYHGSDQIIEYPDLKKGKINNDYGQGFYCTLHKDLACEWASKTGGENGFANEYLLDTAGLAQLDLSQYHILYWITILAKNRTFTITNEISAEAMNYLSENFTIDTSKFDLIKGHRADDSYFSFVKDFLNNAISVQHLSRAMTLGNLGTQYALVSERAFEQLSFVNAHEVDVKKYYPRYSERDKEARKQYQISRTNKTHNHDEVFIIDLIRGGINYEDIRL